MSSNYILLYNKAPSLTDHEHQWSVKFFDTKEEVEHFVEKTPFLGLGYSSTQLYKLSGDPALHKEEVKREVIDEVYTVL